MDKCEWDIMCEIEIFLKKEIGPDLGSRQKIESIFMNIDSNAERVIFNFKGIEFMAALLLRNTLTESMHHRLKWREGICLKMLEKCLKSS